MFGPENMLLLPEDLFVFIPEDTLKVVPKSMSSQSLEHILLFALEDRAFLNSFFPERHVVVIPEDVM